MGGTAFFHAGEMPGGVGATYEAQPLHGHPEDRHAGMRGRTEPLFLDAEAARQWSKPRRRVRSIDQGDVFLPGRVTHLRHVELYKATHRDPYLFPGGGEQPQLKDFPIASQRRLAGPIRELVAARHQSMLSGNYEAGEESGPAGVRRQELRRQQSEPRRGSPLSEDGRRPRLTHKARSYSFSARVASPEEVQELKRLQQIADEYAKMKEENEKLQEDLTKSKRLNKNLRKENRRLFRKQNSAAEKEKQAALEAAALMPPPLLPTEGDDVLQQHVIQQLQSLQMEKAKLLQENCQLTRDNESLQELLHYAVGEQGSGSEDDSTTETDSEDGNLYDIPSQARSLKEHSNVAEEVRKGDEAAAQPIAV